MFVRLTSLDELPQLFNIICGDMSFIGPRPLPIHYFPFFEGVELERFSVRPGISGLAQVNGRNHLQWDKRIDLDVQYVRNYGFLQDLEILRKTIIKVVKSEDIAVDPTQVMIDFDVYKKSLKRNGRK
jgi:lipopolysaccharide/colanic/teichoic acid biosynthesis glycosyltransferase